MSIEDIRPSLVVVGVDGSDGSQKALDWAERYARTTNSILRLFISWEYPALYADAMAVPHYDPEAAAHREIEKMRSGLQLPEDRIECVVHSGPPAESLIDQSRHADVLVVGSRGQGAFTRALLGSVSTHCARGAHCPVAIVR